MSQINLQIPVSEPKWLPSQEADALNQSLQSWLLDPLSLTQRLRKSCQEFSVRVLNEGYADIFASESQLLGKQHARCWVREVELVCDGEVWVFARSVIPQSTLELEAAQIPDLKTKPLGEFLFGHPLVSRKLCQVAALSVGDYGLSQEQFAQQAILWGRRSEFLLGSAPLLVAEVFLPPCAAYNELQREPQ